MALQLKKVIITDSLDDSCREILQQNGISADVKEGLTKEELLREISNYDGIIVRSATKVTADVISASPRLKIIGRAGTGVDNIDCNAATKQGVIVMNTPGGNTLSAAELTCSMVLATSRHLTSGCMSLKEGRWDRKKYMGNEVYGKTLAIVGLGRIGKEVAIRMQSFGMQTIGFDPIISASEAAEFNTRWMTLDELWPLADYITVHTPLIPQTTNLINDDVFSKCKKGVRVINVARGGIIDEDALLRALQSGQCAGAGLDVFLEEPPKNRALIEHPRVTCAPHLGASTVEAQSRVAEEIAQQFVDARDGKSLFGAINAHAMMAAIGADSQPLINLAKKLGKLASCMGSDLTAKTQLHVTVKGCGLKKTGPALCAAVLMGMLQQSTKNGHNLVSAPAYAKDLGAKVTNAYDEASSDVTETSITVTLRASDAGDASSIVLCGSPVYNGQAALFAINKHNLMQPFLLNGNVLLLRAKPEDLKSRIDNVLPATNQIQCMVKCESGAATSGGETYALLNVTESLPESPSFVTSGACQCVF